MAFLFYFDSRIILFEIENFIVESLIQMDVQHLQCFHSLAELVW